MPTTTDWITAISTISMTIATIAIAVIAFHANKTWKEEHSFKKKYEVYTELLRLLRKITPKLSGTNYFSPCKYYNQFIHYHNANKNVCSEQVKEQIDKFKEEHKTNVMKDHQVFYENFEKLINEELKL